MNLVNCASYAAKEYILFLSDDDSLDSTYLPDILSHLETSSPEICTTAYRSHTSEYVSRTYGTSTTHIPTNSLHLSKLLYNFILFSGIIVNKNSFLSVASKSFDGLIYSQVVWSAELAFRSGYLSLPYPAIIPHGDGVIGFGSNSSQASSDLLANRNLLMSPIRYHEHLFKSVHLLSRKLALPALISFFRLEYSLRSYYLLKRAFLIGGRSGVLSFTRRLSENKVIDILPPLLYLYSFIICLLGTTPERLFTFLFRRSPSELYRIIKGGD